MKMEKKTEIEPDVCFFDNYDGETVMVKRGYMGYFRCRPVVAGKPVSAEELNRRLGIDPATVKRMVAGSMFGW